MTACRARDDRRGRLAAGGERACGRGESPETEGRARGREWCPQRHQGGCSRWWAAACCCCEAMRVEMLGERAVEERWTIAKAASHSASRTSDWLERRSWRPKRILATRKRAASAHRHCCLRRWARRARRARCLDLDAQRGRPSGVAVLSTPCRQGQHARGCCSRLPRATGSRARSNRRAPWARQPNLPLTTRSAS